MEIKDLIELVTRITQLECDNRALKAEVAELRQIIQAEKSTQTESEKEQKKDYNPSEVLDELMNGVPDEKLGRVRWTKDGRE